MKQIENFSEIQASTGEYDRPKAGGYIIEILDVQNVELDPSTQKGDYLKIDYDIAEGEYARFYSEQNNRFGGEYKINFIRSYKDKALGMFKHFINCLQESNPHFTWLWNEKALIGLRVGVVLQEEEYQKQNGSISSRLKVKEIKTIQQILSGDFKTPAPITLNKNTPIYNPYDTPNFTTVDDEQLPF